jgi:hypothetical protein
VDDPGRENQLASNLKVFDIQEDLLLLSNPLLRMRERNSAQAGALWKGALRLLAQHSWRLQ